jgi:hypothetical protein
MMRTPSRRRWPWLTALGLLILGVAAAVVLIHPWLVLYDVQTLSWPRHFSPSAWQQHPEHRYQMALDLVGSGQLRGKSESWLRETLNPTATGGSEGGGVFSWEVSSPERPYDYLVIVLRRGVAVRWGVTADPLTLEE